MRCFYHLDLDGCCSAAIIQAKYPQCKLIGMDYGHEDLKAIAEIGKLEPVFIVDYHFQPFARMAKLFEYLGANLVWIDHHKSAIDEAIAWNKEHGDKPVNTSWLIDGIGACHSVWRYCNGDAVIPEYVTLLAEYDVWNHQNTRTLPFQYGMRMQPTGPEEPIWQLVGGEEKVNEIVKTGRTVLQYTEMENAKYAKACAFETELDGLKCIAINKPGTAGLANSKLFDSVWDPEKYDAMLAFGWANEKWHISLYTDKEGVDVSKVAKKHEGGGHQGAAGFQSLELPIRLLPIEDDDLDPFTGKPREEPIEGGDAFSVSNMTHA